MACVSATLLLDLPRSEVGVEDVRQSRRRLRDLRYNPQRHLDSDGSLSGLRSQRAAAVAASNRLRAERPHDARARHEAFESIRAISERMLAARPEVRERYRSDHDRLRDTLRQDEVARRRDYFFGLYRRRDLERILERLPGVDRFRV
jgi:hypothetical protein